MRLVFVLSFMVSFFAAILNILNIIFIILLLFLFSVFFLKYKRRRIFIRQMPYSRGIDQHIIYILSINLYKTFLVCCPLPNLNQDLCPCYLLLFL